MQIAIAEFSVFLHIEFTAALTGRAQMPVYGQSNRLLKTSSTATGHQARSGIVLLRRAIVEIDLRVLADPPANVCAHEPVVEFRSRDSRLGKTVVHCVPGVDASRQGARELMVR